MVYPGAMHTRFEHSLGVMHVATLLYDSILKSSGDSFEIISAIRYRLSKGSPKGKARSAFA